MKYDLEERTANFGEDAINFAKKVKRDIYNEPSIKQLIRSATSIGANYREANGGSSPKDFKNKIHICQKEAKETKYWLQIIGKSNQEIIEEARKLWQEAHELTLIFGKIIVTLNNKKDNKNSSDI
ncbi:MAG: four helix bundle protein [bacterium]